MSGFVSLLRAASGAVGAIASASAASATNWHVWADASASANGDHYAYQYNEECNGTTFDYCSHRSSTVSTANSSTKTNAMQSAVANDPHTRFNSSYGDQHADAAASADLAIGELKVSDHVLSPGGATTENTFGSATAGIQDTLHFASTQAGPVSFVVKLHVDGVIEGQGAQFGFDMGNQYAGALLAGVQWSDAKDGMPSSTSSAYFQNEGKLGDWSQFGPEDFVGRLTYDPAHPDFQLVMTLSAGGPAGTYAEFNHTAAIAFELPSGLSFTSDSGVFLSEQGSSSAPEPASWAMVVVGFGSVGWGTRRGRRRQPIAARLSHRVTGLA